MAAQGPLSGITVVDLSRILAGPYCTFLMTELGARVIKVEAPGKGDDAREYGPFVKGRSTYFASINRGKESIALDLKAPADKRIFEALLAKADVVVENFRPGTMEKLGYGWESLHRRYPRLIYAAASGFGHTGPYANQPAYDMVVQGLGGIMSITGHPGQPPVRIGMFDCQLALLENAIMRYTVTGQVPGPLGARHPSITPFEAFATADGAMIVAAGNDGLFHKLCAALGRPDLAAAPEYKTNDLRNQNEPALKQAIESELKQAPTAAWIERFGRAGIPCGPINNVPQALAHPQVEARNMLITVEDPVAGTLKLAGNPLKLSAFPDPPTRPPAPALDADRAKLLKELGLEG
ncbi:MAG TPA: CaiB/BaiF CoA-transferase family protein [Stellaceae bacterium]|nr:CaiB/BaiF CoA-transferase family protein [Stellaceae bacterium]